MNRLQCLIRLARALDYNRDPDPKHWKTINGAKVHLDKNGNYDGGAGGKFNGNHHYGGPDWKQKTALMNKLTNALRGGVTQKQAQTQEDISKLREAVKQAMQEYDRQFLNFDDPDYAKNLASAQKKWDDAFNRYEAAQKQAQGNQAGNTSAQNVASKVTQNGGGNGIIKAWNKISGEHTIEDDIKSTNPSFTTGKPYQINCQRCVQAYELRRRGYAAVAKPKDETRTDDPVRWGLECFAKPKLGESFWEAAKSMFAFRKRQSDIERELKTAPDGSRYVIYCKWRSRNGGAHVFIATKENGKVKYIDPQSGEMDVGRYFKDAWPGQFGICRLDDKAITSDDNILGEIAEGGKS